MIPDDREGEAREILDGIAPMLHETFAARAWGRLIVYLEPHGNTWIATDLQVEELDPAQEPHVEARFGAPAARSNLPVLAAATQALSVLHDVDLEFLQGGTFVRDADSFHFLPGKVRTPSPGVFAERDTVLAELTEKNRRLAEQFVLEELEASALGRPTLTLAGRDGAAVGVFEPFVLGSYALRRRSWVWGAHNPTVPSGLRDRVARLLDALPDRSAWEVSTPGFTTDPGTAWALGALLVRCGVLDGAARLADDEGWIMLGLKIASAGE